ncbi:hypothetical protein [Nocardioides sp. SR21]|uniref:hypothetical protein n=1 Tax=Nocardioides sp. SR21 TaxID=2919501 RepID=UPI001FAB30BC|nr:hypothetical protein [Nocardioides sp. SR21]
MSRARVATLLGVVAVLCVVATAAVAMSTRDESAPEPAMLTVSRAGSSFQVPAEDWKVEDPAVRVFYTDEEGRPVAVVRGPAVYRAGYCGKGSNQGFAGFTRHPLEAWVDALGEPHSSGAQEVTLGDGAEARLEWARVAQPAGDRCAAAEVHVAMVRTDAVRVVLVADAGEPGALDDAAVRSILRSLSPLP